MIMTSKTVQKAVQENKNKNENKIVSIPQEIYKLIYKNHVYRVINHKNRKISAKKSMNNKRKKNHVLLYKKFNLRNC